MTRKFSYLKIPRLDTSKPFIARPYIPVYLVGDTGSTPNPYYALLDSGADSVIFPSELAETIGISDFTTGYHEQSLGIGKQPIDVFYHPLRLKLDGGTDELHTQVGFAKDFDTPILGRSFFQHFKSVIFEETREQLELRR